MCMAREQKEPQHIDMKNSWPVWYMCLKTENCCLKTFVEICVGEKVCENT